MTALCVLALAVTAREFAIVTSMKQDALAL